MAGKRKAGQDKAKDVAEGRKGDVSPGDEGLRPVEEVRPEDGSPSKATGDPDNPVDTAEGRNEPQPGSENIKPVEQVTPLDSAAGEQPEPEKKRGKKKVKDGQVEARVLFDSIGWANPDWNPDDMERGQRSTKSLSASKSDTETVMLPEAEYDRLEELGAVEPA